MQGGREELAVRKDPGPGQKRFKKRLAYHRQDLFHQGTKCKKKDVEEDARKKLEANEKLPLDSPIPNMIKGRICRQ